MELPSQITTSLSNLCGPSYPYMNRNEKALPGNCVRTFCPHFWGCSVATIDESTFVTAGSYDGIAKLWDIQTRKCLRKFRGHKPEYKLSVASLGSGMFVTVSGGLHSGKAKVWDINRSKFPISSFELGNACFPNCVTNVDGTTMITGSECLEHMISETESVIVSSLYLWDVRTGECLRTFKGHTATVNSTSMLDCNIFASGDMSGTVKLWDIRTGSCLRTIQHPKAVWCVANLDGVSFLTGGSDNTIKQWDTGTGKCMRTYKGHTEKVWSISVVDVKAGNFVTGSWDNTARLWSVDSGECIHVFEGHKGPVVSVANLNGTSVLTAGDKTVKLWRLPNTSRV